jgi:hypothetical protein
MTMICSEAGPREAGPLSSGTVRAMRHVPSAAMLAPIAPEKLRRILTIIASFYFTS